MTLDAGILVHRNLLLPQSKKCSISSSFLGPTLQGEEKKKIKKGQFTEDLKHLSEFF